MFYFFCKKNLRKEEDISKKNYSTAHVWVSRFFERNNRGEINVDTEQEVDGKEVFINQELKKEREGNYGHVSVGSFGKTVFYASHWPGLERTAKGMIKTGVASIKDRKFQDDVKAEKPFKPISIKFYSLEQKKMFNEYKKLADKLWSLKGDKIVMSGVDNCSSFAYKILKAGGINELSSKCSELSSWFRFRPLEPKDILECIKDAKKKELELYPKTKKYEM